MNKNLHNSVLYIDMGQLRRNAEAILRELDGAQLIPVLKGNAYGLGLEKVGAALADIPEGLEDLEQALSEILDTKEFHPEEGVLFTQRQRGDAQAALDSLREGEQALVLGLTLDAVTVCVEDALHALAALTGEQVSEEIVDRVFEEFCVGK